MSGEMTDYEFIEPVQAYQLTEDGTVVTSNGAEQGYAGDWMVNRGGGTQRMTDRDFQVALGNEIDEEADTDNRSSSESAQPVSTESQSAGSGGKSTGKSSKS